jgi:hypothetical protein
VAIPFKLHEVDDALDRLAVPHFLTHHARQEQHLRERGFVLMRVCRPAMRLSRTVMCCEQFAVLERTRDAKPRDRVRAR